MVEFIGWAAIILGGAYIAFLAVAIITDKLLRGGLEKVIPAFFAGVAAAFLWVVASIWMSPITISISAS